MAKTAATKTSAAKRSTAKRVTGSTPVPAKRTAAPKPAKKLNECRCGCGKLVKGAFAQGHDARVYGMVLRNELPESVIADQPGLMSKLSYARRQAEKVATAKAEKAEAKASAPKPEPQVTPDTAPEAETPEPTTETPKVRRRPSRVSG